MRAFVRAPQRPQQGATKAASVGPRVGPHPLRPAPLPLRGDRSPAGAESQAEAPPLVKEALRSPGEPLGAAARAFFEPRLGHDFSHVRVHTDAVASASARSVQALAYTVGRDIVFGERRYAPHTAEGKRLLAHELVHVAQQTEAGIPAAGGSQSPSGLVQRDLATPEPEVPSPPQPDLTDAQISEAIRYNRDRYNQINTRLIQDVLGGPVTGRWTADNIRAIAATQEQYGLKKDGKVGPDTFRFIDQELANEEVGTATEDCLTMFRVTPFPARIVATPGPNGITQLRGHHIVEAQFSSRCNCSEFEYHQRIAGVATGFRGAVSQDFSRSFADIPGGRLPISLREDGNTRCPDRNYGHRDQPGWPSSTSNPNCGEDHYMNDTGATDQPNGCSYRGEDFPELVVRGLQTGDTVDLEVSFRGEIRRNDRVIQSRDWTDINDNVVTP